MPKSQDIISPHRKSSCKLSLEERMRYERWIVSTIRNKLNALCNAQLKSTSEKNSGKKVSRTSDKSIKILTDELTLLLKSVGQKPKVRSAKNIQASREEKLMVRFDGDGWLFPIKQAEELSPRYNAAISQHALDFHTYHSSSYQTPQLPLPQSYDLCQIPIWQESMQKFANYQKTIPIIQQHLSKINFPHEHLHELNFYDLMYIICENVKQTKKFPFEPKGYSNTRMFAACYGDQFRRIMGILDYTPEYIENSLELMKQGALPDIFNRHHITNVQDCKEFNDISKTNDFSNFSIVKIDPIHNGLHRPLDFEINSSIVFMAGYDPLLQIFRNPEVEQNYLSKQSEQNNQNQQQNKIITEKLNARTY